MWVDFYSMHGKSPFPPPEESGIHSEKDHSCLPEPSAVSPNVKTSTLHSNHLVYIHKPYPEVGPFKPPPPPAPPNHHFNIRNRS